MWVVLMLECLHMKWAKKQKGFTIVELLIVVVVIAILAAITIVSFNGIQNRARVAGMQSELVGVAKKIEIYRQTLGGGSLYPSSLATASVSSSSDNTLSYFPSNGSSFCLAIVNGQDTQYITDVSSKPQQGSCVVSDQLISQWLMNSNANDAGSNAINGINNGAVLTNGQSRQANGAYQFNGTSSHITLPANSALDVTTNFSVSTWVKLDANIGTSNWGDILAGASSDVGVGINVNASGVGYLMMTKVSIVDLPRSTNPVVRQVWTHLVATYSTNTVTYYLDGRPNGGAGYAVTFTPSTKRIGSRVGSGFFRGAIDDLRVYGKVLSANEVSILYAGGAQ